MRLSALTSDREPDRDEIRTNIGLTLSTLTNREPDKDSIRTNVGLRLSALT